MSWIDDSINELKLRKQWEAEEASRNRLIAEEAETIYNDLWKEITFVIKEAESKGLQQVLTNGSSFRRKIIIPVMPSHSQKYSNPKEVILRLAEGKLAIIAEGASNLHFSLDLCEDKVVRVRHGGEHKSIKEASELLMRPLLFPELFTQQ